MAISPKTLAKVRTYIDEGVALEDLDLTNAQRERVRIAESVYERLQQDPWLDVVRCLRHVYGRTREQALKDKDIVDLFIETTSGLSRVMLEHRRMKMIEREARIAEQTGDWKVLDASIKHLEKQIESMGEEKDDVIKNTANLPAILVDVNVVDPTKQSLSEKDFRALMHKYGGKLDEIDEMIQERREKLLGTYTEEEPKRDRTLLDDAAKFMDNE